MLTVVPLLIVASVTFVNAFDGSTPLIIAHGNDGSLREMGPATTLASAIESIPCADITLIFDQPQLHASDLSRFAKYFSPLKEFKHSIVIPYSRGHNHVEAIVSSIQQKCDYLSQAKPIGVNDRLSFQDAIYIFKLLPLSGNIRAQQVAASNNEIAMSILIEKVQTLTNNNVIVFTSSKSEIQTLHRRSDFATTSQNSTFIPFHNRNFLQKYILFNMGVFEGGISIFLVAFVSLIGVNLLRSVQTPTKFEEPLRKQ